MKEAQEIMKKMNEIEYGWVDKEGKPHIKLQGMAENYLLQTPEELMKSKLGVCWDQVELERYYFKEKGIDIKSYFIVYYDNKRFPCHTFMSFEKNGKYYWFEHAWESHRGIKEFNSEEDLLKEVKTHFIELELKDEYDEDYLVIYNYAKPDKKLGTIEFYNYCEKGIKVKI
jgi:hypothetical protein